MVVVVVIGLLVVVVVVPTVAEKVAPVCFPNVFVSHLVYRPSPH